MQHARDVDVSIDGYTVRVDDRIYNIGNLVCASVETFPIGFDGGVLAAIWAAKWPLGLGFCVAVSSGVSIGARLIALGVFLGAIGWTVRRLQGRAIGYALMFETSSGTAPDVLVSRDPDAVYGLADAIGDAINHPPRTVEQYVVHGDLVQQIGNDNVAVQVR